MRRFLILLAVFGGCAGSEKADPPDANVDKTCELVTCEDNAELIAACELECRVEPDPCDLAECGTEIALECDLACPEPEPEPEPDPCEGVVCGDASADACGLDCTPACDPTEVVDYEVVGHKLSAFEVRSYYGGKAFECLTGRASNTTIWYTHGPNYGYDVDWFDGRCIFVWDGGIPIDEGHVIGFRVADGDHYYAFTYVDGEFVLTTGSEYSYVIYDFEIVEDLRPVYRSCD